MVSPLPPPPQPPDLPPLRTIPSCLWQTRRRFSQSLARWYPTKMELCESRGGCPGLSVLTSLLVSVDVKIYCTVLRHWSQLVPNMSTDIRTLSINSSSSSHEKAEFARTFRVSFYFNFFVFIPTATSPSSRLVVAGYHGERCQLDYDECATAPCENGGFCQNLQDNFTCHCHPGYEGRNCSTKVGVSVIVPGLRPLSCCL